MQLPSMNDEQNDIRKGKEKFKLLGKCFGCLTKDLCKIIKTNTHTLQREKEQMNA